MTKPVIAVEVVESLGQARKLMAEHRINQLPVLDEERLVGMVTDRDLRDAYPTSLVIDRAKEIDRFAETYTVEEVMTHNLITVQPSTSLETTVKLLRRYRIGSLPVVNRDRLVGIITRSNILEFLLSGRSLKASKVEKKSHSRSTK